jgi:hypothetical protein
MPANVSHRMKLLRRICLIAFIVCLLPVLGILISIGIAQANGCTLHEGFANPCVVLGVDLGGLLYGMSVMGWLGLVTLPIAALTAAIWIIAEIVAYLRRRQRNG